VSLVAAISVLILLIHSAGPEAVGDSFLNASGEVYSDGPLGLMYRGQPKLGLPSKIFPGNDDNGERSSIQILAIDAA
jgi:hypothetical protein